AVGYVNVQWPEPHEISAAEREYLQAVAETTSRAVERARLRDAERTERERIETLSALTRHLAAALTPEAIRTVVSGRGRHRARRGGWGGGRRRAERRAGRWES